MTALTWRDLTKIVNTELSKHGYKHRATPIIVAQVMISGLEIAKETEIKTEVKNDC